MVRGIALFFGIFTLLNIGSAIWWIQVPLLGAFGSAAIAIAFIVWQRHAAIAAAIVAGISAIANTFGYYRLLARGAIHSRFPVPLSIAILATMIAIGMSLLRFGFDGEKAAAGRRTPKWRRAAIGFVAAGILFPVAQIATFGATDYRRPADLIVVFGAHANANGTPSDALADRVRTGVALYRAGLAPRLLFSGGPGDGKFDEPETMRRYALNLGVPASAIELDPRGLNTESTVRNTVALHPRSVLAVSHFYHLPRVKMTFLRYDADVYTVPSENTAGGTLFNLTRETAAFWWYYIRRREPWVESRAALRLPFSSPARRSPLSL